MYSNKPLYKVINYLALNERGGERKREKERERDREREREFVTEAQVKIALYYCSFMMISIVSFLTHIRNQRR